MAEDSPKLAEVHLLPGASMSPRALLGQLIADSDDVVSVVAVIQWKGGGVSVRHSKMNLEAASMASVLLAHFVGGWLQECASTADLAHPPKGTS